MILTRKMLPALLLVFTTYCSQAGEIVRLTKDNLRILPKGKEVDGMIGDWVLKNDKIVAVIANASHDREANQMVSSIQGAVIDFTTLSANNDQLTVYYPQGARVDIQSADTIIVLAANGKEIQLKAIKYATEKEPFTAETTYSLADGDAFLKVKTVYKNTSSAEIKVPVYDFIRCDNLLDELTPSGYGNLAFMNNKWYNSAYGISSSDRRMYTSVKKGKRNLITLGHRVYFDGLAAQPEEPVSLLPGKELVISRTFLTGETIADLQFQQIKSGMRKDLLKTDVLVMDTRKKNLAGVFVDVRNDKGEIITSAITNSKGIASVLAPNGNYSILISKPGHNDISEKLEIKSASQKRTFLLKPEARIAFTVKDGEGNFIPVKLEFKGINGTKDPNLGPATRSNGLLHLYYSNSSNFSVPLPEGEYEIVVSHGPEYNIQKLKIRCSSG